MTALRKGRPRSALQGRRSKDLRNATSEREMRSDIEHACVRRRGGSSGSAKRMNLKRGSRIKITGPMSHVGQSRRFRDVGREFALPPTTDIVSWTGHVRKVLPNPEVTGESATSGQARDDHAASLLTLDLIRAADDAPSSDSPYPTSRTMRSFNG